ncbi:hypothetical protein WBG99_05690 [Streptomyces sp. TG1A-60]|uniref:hypothetical protein n=1 Tax=Streptomyces sp. TG1A-60 TaxID=3129111 RepID=UPI0030D1F5CD
MDVDRDAPRPSVPDEPFGRPLALQVAVDQLAAPEDPMCQRSGGTSVTTSVVSFSSRHSRSAPDPPPGKRHPTPTMATASVY